MTYSASSQDAVDLGIGAGVDGVVEVDGTVEVTVPVVEMATVELDATDRTQVDVTVRALQVGDLRFFRLILACLVPGIL